MPIETEMDIMLKSASTPTIYNVTMTLADTEYSQAFPKGTNRFAFSIRDGAGANSFKIAFAPTVGETVPPYLKYTADSEYCEGDVDLNGTTLYFSCSVAAQVAQIICWA